MTTNRRQFLSLFAVPWHRVFAAPAPAAIERVSARSALIDNSRDLYLDALIHVHCRQPGLVHVFALGEDGDPRLLANGDGHRIGPLSVAQAFGGMLPERWGIAVTHSPESAVRASYLGITGLWESETELKEVFDDHQTLI